MYIEQYYNQVKAGNIIVGTEIKAQMELLMDDIQNPSILKDFKASEKRINFIEKECRHFEAPFAGKPFLLELFQKMIIEAIFALKIYSEEAGRHIRKYQEVLIEIGRKNGKTPFVSAICLSEFVCGEMGTKILYGSNDYEQADLLFQATDAMREESPKIAKCTRKNLKGIFWGSKKQKNKRGKFSSQNKGSIRKISARTGAKEGRNIKVGVADEVHEMQDNTMVMPIRQALSTQIEPLFIEITTDGFTDDGYLDARLNEARQVLRGEVERPNWLIFLYTQDSEEEIWQNKKSWYKSNPGIGVIKKWSFLEKMVQEAQTNTSTRAFVLAKDFNIKQNSAAAWLQDADIENSETFKMEELRGKYYIGALDLAETTDLCNAKAAVIDPVTGKKYITSMYFIPETKADAILEDDNKLNPEKKDYRKWAKEGKVVICPGSEVDAQYAANWFIKLAEEYRMLPYKIGYDNWHAKDFKKIIGQHFGEEVLERINMDFMSLSGAMRAVESDLKLKKINYNNNEVDRWCLKNTSYTTNNLGLIMPIKKYGQSKNRIDGTLGFIILQATYSRFKSDYIKLCQMRGN